MHDVQTAETPDGGKAAVNSRIEDIGWGLILMITGGAFLMPGWEVPWATWLIGIGTVMLGLNVVRSRRRIRVKPFTTILGGLALIAGVGNFLGFNLELPLLAVLLLALGAAIVLKPFIKDER